MKRRSTLTLNLALGGRNWRRFTPQGLGKYSVGIITGAQQRFTNIQKNKLIFPNSVVIFFENGKGEGMNNNFQKNLYPGEDS